MNKVSRPLFKHNDAEEYIIDDNLMKIYPEKSRLELLRWLVEPPETTYLRVNLVKVKREELIKKIENVTAGNDVKIEAHGILNDVIVITKNKNSKLGVEYEVEEKSIIVGSSCAAAVLRGAEIFAPGILAASISLNKGDKVAVYADLTNKLLKGSTKFEVQNYTFLGVGVARLSRSELFKDGIQAGLGVIMTRTCHFQCPRINDEMLKPLSDLYLMQNLPSILTVHQLEIAANDKCLDMCAAPGGKTTHIASILAGLNGQGHVLAFDKSKPKIQQIEANGQRFGVSDKITAAVQDSVRADLPSKSFDKILLDGPCSALGQRPMLVQESRAKELKSFAKLQKKLFEKAVELLKPGGLLVYSTCTITLEENESLVQWAIDKFENVLDIQQTWPRIGQPGDESVLAQNAEKVQRFGPGDSLSTIGYFLAKFKRKSVE